MNFYECCDLMEKVYLTYIYGVNLGEINFLLIEIWGLQHNIQVVNGLPVGFFILQKPGFTGRVHPFCISLFKNYIRRSQGERAIFVDPSSIHPLGLP